MPPDVKELVGFIARGLVDDPDAVQVAVQEDEETVAVELRVAKEDLGKVIGKQGRTAKAMRTVLASVVSRQGKRSRLDIVE